MAAAQVPTQRSPRQSRDVDTGEVTGVAWRAKAGRPAQIAVPVIAPAATMRRRRDNMRRTWVRSRRCCGVLVCAWLVSLFIGSRILSLSALGDVTWWIERSNHDPGSGNPHSRGPFRDSAITTPRALARQETA